MTKHTGGAIGKSRAALTVVGSTATCRGHTQEAAQRQHHQGEEGHLHWVVLKGTNKASHSQQHEMKNAFPHSEWATWKLYRHSKIPSMRVTQVKGKA